MDFDFGYNRSRNADDSTSSTQNNDVDNVTDIDGTGNANNDNTNLNKLDNDNNGNVTDNQPNNSDGNTDNDKKDGSASDLQAGTSIEVGDQTYTVDESGNVIDKDGNIFKEAKDVKEWLDSFDQVNNETDEITINSIQDLIGTQITDENDKPIEFENSPAGVKAYLDAVIEAKREEHYETAINTLYQKYPILEDVLNYYITNGNSLKGFGEVPDRSNVTIDENNEAQQIYIIRTAWEEQNRKGDVNGYIEYLKASDLLLATAKEELAGLQEADKQYRDNLAAEAERKEQEQLEDLQKYWNGVYDVVKSRQIAGYQIPETIVINRNGQKISVTPEDFFNYVYRVDKDGMSAYERDLAKETPESRRDDEILRAYLKFVGGNYSNLVGMAVNKDKVNTLKLKAKERTTSSVRITNPKTKPATGKDLDLGYN